MTDKNRPRIIKEFRSVQGMNFRIVHNGGSGYDLMYTLEREDEPDALGCKKWSLALRTYPESKESRKGEIDVAKVLLTELAESTEIYLARINRSVSIRNGDDTA